MSLLNLAEMFKIKDTIVARQYDYFVEKRTWIAEEVVDYFRECVDMGCR